MVDGFLQIRSGSPTLPVVNSSQNEITVHLKLYSNTLIVCKMGILFTYIPVALPNELYIICSDNLTILLEEWI